MSPLGLTRQIERRVHRRVHATQQIRNPHRQHRWRDQPSAGGIGDDARRDPLRRSFTPRVERRAHARQVDPIEVPEGRSDELRHE